MQKDSLQEKKMMLREDERQFEKGQMRNGLEEKHEGGEKNIFA